MAKRLTLICAMALFIPACAHRTAPLAPQAAEKFPVICRLVARDQTITISAGPNGSVYSVQNAKGEMLLSYASREELRLHHPDLSHQLDSAIVSGDARWISKPITSLDIPAGSIDRMQMPSIFRDGPIMLKSSE